MPTTLVGPMMFPVAAAAAATATNKGPQATAVGQGDPTTVSSRQKVKMKKLETGVAAAKAVRDGDVTNVEEAVHDDTTSNDADDLSSSR